mgnify:CR=1 FL=1
MSSNFNKSILSGVAFAALLAGFAGAFFNLLATFLTAFLTATNNSLLGASANEIRSQCVKFSAKNRLEFEPRKTR